MKLNPEKYHIGKIGAVFWDRYEKLSWVYVKLEKGENSPYIERICWTQICWHRLVLDPNSWRNVGRCSSSTAVTWFRSAALTKRSQKQVRRHPSATSNHHDSEGRAPCSPIRLAQPNFALKPSNNGIKRSQKQPQFTPLPHPITMTVTRINIY